MSDKILVIAPSWIGDMIMANALLRLLKATRPHCVIDVLAPHWSHPVIARMKEVRHAMLMPLGHGSFNVLSRYRLGKSLREAKYDEAIVLPNSWKSALVPFFARIPKRVGWRGEWRYGLLTHVYRLDKKKYPKMLQRYLALGVAPHSFCPKTWDEKCFWPSLIVDEVSRHATLKKYHLHPEKPLLILCPGAQYGASKRWPQAYFSELAAHYLAQSWQVGLLGGKAEKELAMLINASLNHEALDLTATSLTEAMDILSLAHVVVSNDSGLMHLACALKRPTIAIYGSSSPDFTPPLAESAVVLSRSLSCKPCFQRECPLKHLQCLTMITPDQVIHAIAKMNRSESFVS